MATKAEVRLDQPYTLRIDTEIDLSTGSALKYLYRTPAGVEGEVSASLASGSTEILEARVDGATNAVAGAWRFQASVLFSGDTAATTGEPVTIISRALWEAPGV